MPARGHVRGLLDDREAPEDDLDLPPGSAFTVSQIAPLRMTALGSLGLS